MRVMMVAMAAGPGGVWPAGSVQDLDEERATALVEGGFAVAVERDRQDQGPADDDAQPLEAAEDDERPEQLADDGQAQQAADEEAPATRTRRRRKK